MNRIGSTVKTLALAMFSTAAASLLANPCFAAENALAASATSGGS